MNIGINARIFKLGIGFGLTQVGINLFKNLLELDKKNNYIFFCNDEFQLPFEGNYSKIIIKSNKLFFDWFHLPKALKTYNIDVFISPQTTVGFLDKSIKSISIVNDIGYVHGYYGFFDNLYWKLNFAYAFKKADKIASISKFTKDEILKNYSISEQKIETIHLGRSDFFAPDQNLQNLKEIGINKKFILCIGSCFKRKNLGNAIRAFNLVKKDIDTDMIIITRNLDETKKVFNLENEDLSKIIFLEKVSNEVLKNLYSSCEFTLIPSIYEGFGFPLIEAQACGSVVANADNSSLHEIANGTTLEFNPFDIQNIADAIKVAYNLPSEKKTEYIDKGFKNILNFDRKITARKYLDIINLLGKK